MRVCACVRMCVVLCVYMCVCVCVVLGRMCVVLQVLGLVLGLVLQGLGLGLGHLALFTHPQKCIFANPGQPRSLKINIYETIPEPFRRAKNVIYPG